MDTEYQVQLSVSLQPVGCADVVITAGPDVIACVLDQPQTIHFEFVATNSFDLTVELRNKAELDPYTAVEIARLDMFGISDPRFLWAGVYRPNYPAHLSQQPPVLPGQTYLSWNGTYRLTVTVPVFVWMHQTLNMGWLYD